MDRNEDDIIFLDEENMDKYDDDIRDQLINLKNQNQME
jgi:hypothetical protein